MGIFKRLGRVIKGNVNDLFDKMSDPAKEVELLILEMEEGLKEAREEVMQVTITAKATDKRCDELRKDADKWQERAEKAVRSGDDELARGALQKRNELLAELQNVREAAAEQHGRASELKEHARELEAKLKEVRVRKETLKQRARAAKSGESKLAGAKAFSDFDKFEAKIEAMEEVADLEREVSSSSLKDAETNRQFARLAARNEENSVDDELAALKAKIDDEG